jgi:hypothetical protein
MTLVLTDISKVGVAMVADSAITYLNPDGTVKQIDQRGWPKLFKVPFITAAVSYWGCVGCVVRNERFYEWLQRKINDTTRYSDLHSFADYLAAELNAACNGRPLKDGECVGVHVAGFADWQDGESRPFFYHVHNGHGDTKIRHLVDPKTDQILKVIPKWDPEPRKLFEKHQDFPKNEKTLEENVETLNDGYITRNGDYFVYSRLHESLLRVIRYINLIDGWKVPRSDNAQSRMAMLKMMLETVIMIYQCSNKPEIIGGEVSCLSISPAGLYSNEP